MIVIVFPLISMSSPEHDQTKSFFNYARFLYFPICPCLFVAVVGVAYAPVTHTHIRTRTESFGSNRSRPQKNEGGA